MGLGGGQRRRDLDRGTMGERGEREEREERGGRIWE